MTGACSENRTEAQAGHVGIMVRKMADFLHQNHFVTTLNIVPHPHNELQSNLKKYCTFFHGATILSFLCWHIIGTEENREKCQQSNTPLVTANKSHLNKPTHIFFTL
jgi:hypothetical protein